MRVGQEFVWHVDSAGLRKYRETSGLSRPQFAALVGLHPKTIQDYETRPDPQISGAAAEKLGRVAPVVVGRASGLSVSPKISEWQGRSASLTFQWRKWLTRRLLSESTISTYERAIRRLEVHSGKPRPAIGLTDVERYLRDPMLGPSIKQQTFVAYRLWHKWGAAKGYWRLDDELIIMRFPKTRRGPRPALSAEEAGNLIAAATTPVEKRLVYLGLYTGLRLAEIVSIDERSWKGPMLEATVKGDWMHRIPVHENLAEGRSEILSDQPSRRVVQRACQRLQRFVGYPITPHWLRRSFAERLADIGVERDVVGALLGHSPRSVTVEAYAPVTWTEMTKAIDRLSYPIG